MTAQIRKANVADIPTLIRLRFAFLTDFFGETKFDPQLTVALRDYFSRELPAGNCIAYLAEADRRAIATGFLIFRPMPPSHMVPTGQEAYIANVYTHPAHRGRSIATEILRRLIADARTAGCSRVGLHAAVKARPLYQRAGFEPVDSEMRLVFDKEKG
jgi:GNAT superfamily N-acetyltransferase